MCFMRSADCAEIPTIRSISADFCLCLIHAGHKIKNTHRHGCPCKAQIKKMRFHTKSKLFRMKIYFKTCFNTLVQIYCQIHQNCLILNFTKCEEFLYWNSLFFKAASVARGSCIRQLQVVSVARGSCIRHLLVVSVARGSCIRQLLGTISCSWQLYRTPASSSAYMHQRYSILHSIGCIGNLYHASTSSRTHSYSIAVRKSCIILYRAVYDSNA